jgi:glycerol-3-phosphate dehydrogenase
MIYDLFIIGGGVNGCGIARDASGRGLKVFLAEQSDLASGTSSASTKLIHGGLRYLEYYEFRLVREALIEREVLLQAAPHIIWPLRFVLPHHKGLRPWPILRLGLFLYDHLGGRKILPGTRSVDFRTDVTGQPLKDIYTRGYEYSDCWVEDARLVVLNARDAESRGAIIRTRTKCVSARRVDGVWELTVQPDGGAEEKVRARALINSAGPWVSQVLGAVVGRNDPDKIRLVKGSHLVVDKLYDHDRCYIFQNTDGRICFTIPYERDFTLIGTTDLDYSGDPKAVAASEEEIVYLCAAASEYFEKPVTRADVVWSFSGVRPLYDDGASKAQEATRDYVLTLDVRDGGAPLLSVFGGKITTYRRLAEAALEKLSPHLPLSGQPAGWTGRSALPGGDFPVEGLAALREELLARYPFLEPDMAARYARTYGRKVFDWLGFAKDMRDLGEGFGAGLTAREIRYLIEQEWARSGDDILWRRTKLGLHLTPAQRAGVTEFTAEFMAGEAGKTGG